MAKKMVRDFSANHREQYDKITNQVGRLRNFPRVKGALGSTEKSKLRREHFYLETAKNHNQKYTAREMPPAITFPTVCITKAFTSTVN